MNISVLVVGSSGLRATLNDAIQRDRDLTLVGAATDAFDAREQILKHEPQLMVLELNLPKLDGVVFLRRLMAARPMPVVAISTSVERGTSALAAGAIDVFRVDENGAEAQILAYLPRLKAIASARYMQPPRPNPRRMVAIGVSTGGPQTIERLLKRSSAECPPIVIVQHMPPDFTGLLASRLNECCPMEVLEASNNDEVKSGRVLLAPGGCHSVVVRSGSKLRVQLRSGPLVQYVRPSADVLFFSVARQVGKHALGIILTGMGEDGTEGLLAMRAAGAQTIAQDRATSLVYGMPKAAAERGAAERILPLDRIPRAIERFARHGATA